MARRNDSGIQWMMRLGLAAVAWACVGARGEGVGGYMLFSKEGDRSTSPGQAVAEIPMAQVFAMAVPMQYENGAQLVASMVTQAEGVARRSPTAQATNVQREDLQAEKAQAMQRIAEGIVGRKASFGIEVMDVVHRPMPGASSPEMAVWAKAGTMVIGRVDWMTPVVPSVEYRRAVAEANAEAAGQVKEVSRQRAAEPRSKYGERREIQEGLKRRLAELRAEYEGKRPSHYVYLVGSDQAFAMWKRGDRRACRGIVQRAGLFVYVGGGVAEALTVGKDGRADQREAGAGEEKEDFSEAYVGLELTLRAMPDAPVVAGKVKE